MSTKKITYTLLLTSTLFLCLTTPTVAAETIDPRCMTLDDCKTMRKKIGVPDAELANGFQTRADSREVTRSCPEKMFGVAGGEQKEAGLCLPAQAAETKIAIGGKTTFLSLAEYIAYIYRYSMIVAGALCVLLFIVAGIEWTMSGGDGSRIDEAKGRISNAITGLILMATSYVVLYTVDPNLTTLKPPEVYMVRGVNAFDPWCSSIPNEDMALGKASDLNQPNAEPTPFGEADFSARPGTATCGFSYHISASEGQMCKGDHCERSPTGEIQTCGQKTSTSTPACIPGNIVGRIYSSNFFENSTGFFARHAIGTAGNFLGVDGIAEGWGWPWVSQATTQNDYDEIIAKDISLYIVCNDGTYQEIDNQFSGSEVISNRSETEKSQFYSATASFADTSDATQNFCGGIPDRKGYVLLFDLNEFSDTWDEGHFIGKNGTEGIDLGDYTSKTSSSTECLFEKIPANYFIQYTHLTDGIQINLDVSKVYDIDNEEDRVQAYSIFNFDQGCTSNQQYETRQQQNTQDKITQCIDGVRANSETNMQVIAICSEVMNSCNNGDEPSCGGIRSACGSPTNQNPNLSGYCGSGIF